MHVSRRRALSSAGLFLTLSALSSVPFARASSPRKGRATRADREAFLAAVVAGDHERVRRMLDDDASLARTTDAAGRSAFVLASLAGHEEVAEALRATGLELDLVEAVLASDWERFEALADAHPERLDELHPIGGTPLYGAALVGSLGFWRLRSYGTDPDRVPAGGSGFTPARGALESASPVWARIALTDLCANGSDVNAPQRGGDSVLHGAVRRRDETLVRLAIRKGANAEARDEQGRTARDLATELGWEAGARLLAEPARLARDNRSSRFALNAQREPVERADLSGVPLEQQRRVTSNSHFNLKVVRELLAEDPRLVFSISGDDELAIEACAHTGARDVIRCHLDHGAPLSLPTAVSLGDMDSVDFWLERDPSLIHERGAHDMPVMWYAVLGGGSVEMAERLALYDVPVDQESRGGTALHWCVKRRDAELAEWLLEHGADPEPVSYVWSRTGETPLALALAEGEAKLAGLLRAKGATR